MTDAATKLRPYTDATDWSVHDPGRVKTPTPATRVETSLEKLRVMRTDSAAGHTAGCDVGELYFYISPMYKFSHSLDPKETSLDRSKLSLGITRLLRRRARAPFAARQGRAPSRS
jgi:hypothetical protein